ncbi:MAG: hypothetical protein C0506_01150 [Anaerolinea sp.]|nr:hypothetical protein [Anaerolinea sp.]
MHLSSSAGSSLGTTSSSTSKPNSSAARARLRAPQRKALAVWRGPFAFPACPFPPASAYYAAMANGDIAGPLLADLQALLEDKGVAYAEPPSRLTGGFDTAIWAFRLAGAPPPFAGPLVARVFGPGQGHRARWDAALQSAVAAQGYPAPAALHACETGGALGQPYVLMPRVPGKTMLQSGLFHIPGTLASSQARLHALDPSPIRDSLRKAGIPEPPSGISAWLEAVARELRQPGMEPFRPAFEWFAANQPPDTAEVLCHLDFHPLNILVLKGEVSGVIDWSNAAFGDPAADVAVTRILLTVPPVSVPGLPGPTVTALRRWMAWRYTRAYRAHHPLDMAAVRYYEAMRCFRAISHLSQRRLAEAEGRAANASGYAWADPATVSRLTRRFHRTTGIVLQPLAAAVP